MPSRALQDFEERLRDIDQLLDAHGALVRLRKAEEALDSLGGELSKVSKVIDALVAVPGPGRPTEVQALNGAAIALLSGHVQGYITDLFEEVAHILLTTHVADVRSVVASAPTRGNPTEENINRLFGVLGFGSIVSNIGWQKMSHASLRKKMHQFNELRNHVVHGRKETVRKSKVVDYTSMWRNFARQLDRKLGRELKKLTGEVPWVE